MNAMGRIFMTELDCPFRAIDAELGACPLKQGADAILIDFHAEATSEKQALGYFVDGRASVLVGTHTHAPTSDERILPGGTAFMSDAGMCGDYNSVLGMETEEPVNRFLTRIPRGRFEPASGPGDAVGPGGRDRRRHGARDGCRRAAARRRSETARAPVLGGVSAAPRAVCLDRTHRARAIVGQISIPHSRQDPPWPAIQPVQEHHAQKGRKDAVRAKLFAKFAREITVAAKAGTPDPGHEPAAAARHPDGARREHAQGQYRARDQEGARAATAPTSRACATRAMRRAAWRSSSRR